MAIAALCIALLALFVATFALVAALDRKRFNREAFDDALEDELHRLALESETVPTLEDA